MSDVRRLVCVVDDDESSRESLEGLLRSAGYEVHAFGFAADFLEWDERATPDCLVLDFAMSPMNGADLHRALTARGRRYPIIFVTAFADGELESRLVAAGAICVLPKPFDDEALLSAIRTAVGPPPG
jgi:FixJ family two-component response regulator